MVKFHVGFFLSMSIFVMCAIAGQHVYSMRYWALLPFAAALASVLGLYWGVRCPRCRNSIGYLAYLPRGGPLKLSKAIAYCPFCGLCLADNIEGVRREASRESSSS